VLDRLQKGAVVVVELVADHGRLAVTIDFDYPRQQQIRRAAEPDLTGPGKAFDVFEVLARHGSSIPLLSTRKRRTILEIRRTV
jgi:hypothetical protein